jgi:hypothetical protein
VENQQSFVTRVAEAGVSRKTVLNVMGTLSSMLNTAKDWGYTCEPIDIKQSWRNVDLVDICVVFDIANNRRDWLHTLIINITWFLFGSLSGT